MPCGILGRWPGLEARPSPVRARSSNHWAKEFPVVLLWMKVSVLRFTWIADSGAVIRHNSERAHVPFIHVAPLGTSCKTLEQHLGQDAGTDAAEMQNVHHISIPPVALVSSHLLPSLLHPLCNPSSTDLFSSSLITLSQKSYICRTAQHVTFGDWTFALSITLWGLTLHGEMVVPSLSLASNKHTSHVVSRSLACFLQLSWLELH